jgi:hypothetical protein
LAAIVCSSEVPEILAFISKAEFILYIKLGNLKIIEEAYSILHILQKQFSLRVSLRGILPFATLYFTTLRFAIFYFNHYFLPHFTVTIILVALLIFFCSFGDLGKTPWHECL